MYSAIFLKEMFPKSFPQRNLLAFLGNTTFGTLSSFGSFKDAASMQECITGGRMTVE